MALPIRGSCPQLGRDDLKEVSARAAALCNQAVNLASNGHFRRALRKALNAAVLYDALGDTVNKSRALGQAAGVCQAMHQYRAAAYYYWKGLRCLGKKDGEKDIAHRNWMLGNLARVYRHLWEFTKAEKYNWLQLKISMETNNMIQTGYAHLGLGLNDYYQDDWDAASEHTRIALEIFRSLGEKRLEFTARLNMACIYNSAGQTEKARTILEEIIALDDLPPDPGLICRAFEELSRVYLRMGDHKGFEDARNKTAEWASRSKSLVDMGRVIMLDAERFWLQGHKKKAVQNARKAIVVYRNHGATSTLRIAEKILFGWLKGEVRRYESSEKIGDGPDSRGHARGPVGKSGPGRSGRPDHSAPARQRDHDRQVGLPR